MAYLLVRCRCPGRVHKTLFSLVFGSGATAAAATQNINGKIAAKEAEYKTQLGDWYKAVQCSGITCEKHTFDPVINHDPPVTPYNTGSKWQTVAAVRGFSIAFCKPRGSAKKED